MVWQLTHCKVRFRTVANTNIIILLHIVIVFYYDIVVGITVNCDCFVINLFF